VSLHWHKRLRIFLAPQQVSLMEVSGVLRKQVTQRQVIPVEQMPGVPQWQPAMTALEYILRIGSWHAPAADVVLSAHFARYTLIPWSDQLANRQERHAFLRHCFYLAYGEPSRQWDLRMSTPAPDASSLASGVSLELLVALNAVLAKNRIKVGAVYPAIMAGANQSRRMLRHGSVWFAVKEPGRLDLALLEDGHWGAVSSHDIGTEAPEAFSVLLETLITRESALLGKPDRGWPVVLYWPGKVPAADMFARKVIPVKPHGAGSEHPDAFSQLLVEV